MEGRPTEFLQQDFNLKDDLLNDDTFGGSSNIAELNDDWEMHHEQFSKLLEIEHDKHKKSSPLRTGSQNINIPSKSDDDHESGFHEKHSGHLSDEEEEIIGNTISQLHMDDEDEYIVKKSSSHSQSMEFRESEESWNSPSRGKDTHSDSLHELISPGDGVWSSPSRATMHGSADQAVPIVDLQRKEGEDIIKKLFGGHNIVTGKKDTMSPTVATPIRVEDLERGLRPEEQQLPPFMKPPMPNLNTPVNPIHHMHPLMQLPFGTPPSGLPMPSLTPRFNKPSPGVNDMKMASLMMMNRPMVQLGGVPGLPPLYPPLISPFSKNPFLSNPGRMNLNQRGSPRGRSPYSNRGRGRGQYNNDKSWYRNQNRHDGNRDFMQQEHEHFIQMEPSKMMNAKEKEWIFKISLMSLLSGDPNISDYYFISHMNKKLIKKAIESEGKKKSEEDDEEDVNENLEKTKKLMNYAQKQQQAKESHRPVKFEGSLGKLSITSVHHPRQIMDFSTPEQEKTYSRVPESGKKKFAMYGLIEKIYDTFLSLSDVERQLLDASPEQQDSILQERTAKINKIFDWFKISLHSTQEESDFDHFLHLMSISKTRKLIPRILLYFTQKQCESFLAAIIHVLPALLKKDKEQSLLPVNDKFKIILKKSTENQKLNYVRGLRKISLKMLLSYKLSIKLLATVLDSLKQKDPSQSLEWSFYQTEVPNMMMDISDELRTSNERELTRLNMVLNVNELLIKIEE